LGKIANSLRHQKILEAMYAQYPDKAEAINKAFKEHKELSDAFDGQGNDYADHLSDVDTMVHKTLISGYHGKNATEFTKEHGIESNSEAELARRMRRMEPNEKQEFMQMLKDIGEGKIENCNNLNALLALSTVAKARVGEITFGEIQKSGKTGVDLDVGTRIGVKEAIIGHHKESMGLAEETQKDVAGWANRDAVFLRPEDIAKTTTQNIQKMFKSMPPETMESFRNLLGKIQNEATKYMDLGKEQ